MLFHGQENNNAYFFVQASALSDETLDSLRRAQVGQHEMRVLVDTNFLFSMLRLHDNPTNEVAETADALLTRIRDKLSVRLYVLPITVEEARNTLGGQIEALSGIRLNRNLARAVVDQAEMPGLTQRYLQEAAGSDKPLSPEDFFGPYESNLVAVLRERGVELFNVSMDAYRTDQTVIDDVLAEEEYQTAHPRGPKPCESNLHDIVLWHFVNRKRPAVVESPLDAQYWIVTEDFRFMGFDRWKRYGRGLPICLSPAVLMQLLRFWIPRSEELEKALVASIRAPFLFPAFDLDAERVTARILRALSRYEGIADLSVENPIKEILMSEALRQRIAEVPPGAEEEAILREAFVQQTRLMEERLRYMEADVDMEIARSEALTRQVEERAAKARELSARVEGDHERIQGLEHRLDEAQKDSRRREEEYSDRERRWRTEREQDARRWFTLSAGLAFFVCAGAGVATWFGLERLPWPEWLRLLAATVAGAVPWFILCQLIGTRLLRLHKWGPVRALARIRIALWALIGATAVGVLGTAIYEAVFNSR